MSARWRSRGWRRLPCPQVVETVTDYLEGTLDRRTTARVRAHLTQCRGCAAFFEQVRLTVRTLGAFGRAGGAHPAALDREALRAAFRERGAAG